MSERLALAAIAVAASSLACDQPTANLLRPIPDGVVVLTFDDGNKSDIAFVAPTLQEYGFRADLQKQRYVSWDDVRRLHDRGFEVGNHTGGHPNMTELSKEEIRSNLELIEQRCEQHGIPTPRTFVYPGWRHSLAVVEVLSEKGYMFARRGVSPEHSDGGRGARGRAYDPEEDHPLLIPTTGYAGPEWGFEDLVWAVDQARDGKIAVLTFHGVPALEHPWVHADPEVFIQYMDYLKQRACTVISVRDLARYVDPGRRPSDPYEPITRRISLQQAGGEPAN